jgi:voltage-gated potassium channel Kch
MNQEIHTMMINIMPVFAFIYDALITIWNVFKVIIDGVRTYTPIVYNFMWMFTETLYDRGFDDDEPISPKSAIIDNSWCNIDPNNIIVSDKKRM